MDRNAQFAPIIGLLPQMLAQLQTADTAEDALRKNAAEVTRLRNLYLAAKQKADPFAGAQAQDFLNLGNAQIALENESAKSAALQADATNAKLAFRQQFFQAEGFLQNLLQD